MRILTRYIVFDLLKVFLLTLTSMTMFVLVGLAGKEAVENGLGLLPLFRMLPFLLPQALQYAVPGTMLLATTVVYGRVSASNEIVAIKSMGISPMKMIWPTLVLATLVSFAAVWVNDVAVSWGRGGVHRVFFESLEQIAYGKLRTSRSFTNDTLRVLVRRVDERTLIQPTILYYPSGAKTPITVVADEAEIRANPAEEAVVIQFVNAEVDLGGKGYIYHPGEWNYAIPASDFSGRGSSARSVSEYALREIGPSKVEQQRRITRLKQEQTAEAAHAMMTGRMFELAPGIWRAKERQVAAAETTLHRLYTEPHRRWANGFSCLGFVLIGAPMAIWRRHGEIASSFFVCFLPILICYYPLLVGAVIYAKDGTLPAPTVWLGNLVLAGVGIWLVRRIVRF